MQFEQVGNLNVFYGNSLGDFDVVFVSPIGPISFCANRGKLILYYWVVFRCNLDNKKASYSS